MGGLYSFLFAIAGVIIYAPLVLACITFACFDITDICGILAYGSIDVVR